MRNRVRNSRSYRDVECEYESEEAFKASRDEGPIVKKVDSKFLTPTETGKISGDEPENFYLEPLYSLLTLS